MNGPYVSTATAALTTGDCDVTAYTAASAQGQVMIAGSFYRLICTTDAWIKIAASPTAVAATDGNIFMPAGQELFVQAHTGSLKVAAIRATADGSLSQVRVE